MTVVFWLAVLQIIVIDVLLSGDNAVVIALACRSLPPRQRRIGISAGVVLALALRLVMAATVAYLLAVPFLKIIGGLLLFYIAIKLIRGEDEDAGKPKREATRLLTAIGLIVVADATMSLDNVVAIAAAAHGNDLVFVIGLAISMPLMIVGASLITVIVTRYPVLIWAGGALLGWIAGAMIAEDPTVVAWTPPDSQPIAYYAGGFSGLVWVVGVALLFRLAARRSALTSTKSVR